ncbi:HAD family hydrolase [Nocardioides sp.]|uniref:HAD family hydrolase n=1 Tax=Nocardioides sp. TaxID=35761 RepID=UPI00239298AC|nr:HAD family hydrolase [Nocardioides sp.]MDE0777519.1 HAD family hydrolase [Nocardioides sp.]
MTVSTAILDLDGTLVDSVYAHTLAWRAAFRDVGVDVPAYRLHRLIGMGGDRLVTEAAGERVEDALGDELRARHPEHLDHLFQHVTAVDGAGELLQALHDLGLHVVLASSGDAELTRRLLGLVEGSDALLDEVVTGSDASRSKPDGELLTRALGDHDRDTAVVIGDAVWDVHAARDAGLRCVSVLTGGFSRAELYDAGAVDVLATARSLAERLRDSGSLLIPDGDSEE